MAECESCKTNETTLTKDIIDGMQETIRNLYLADKIPWIIGYSGGKDSTAALQLVWLSLSALPAEKLRKTVHIINTDTLVESPVVAKWAENSLKKMDEAAEAQGLPFVTHRLTPKYDNTFWVNLLGRGYPFPRKRFRWCTDRLKIRPVNDFIKECIARHGEIILVLGTRKSESANRAKTMAYYEKRRVRELLSPNPTLANELVFSPLENWNNNDVWLFLMQYKNPWGYDNNDLLTMYKGATEDGECPMMVEAGLPSCGKSRFGCWVCTMVEQDKSMEAMIANDSEKEWMTPLLEFRNFIGNEQEDRSRRDFRRKGGYLQGCHGRLNHGPYNKATRSEWLERLLQIQLEINQNGPEEFSKLELITIPELVEIRKIWVNEKHEFDDELPRIYERVMGVPFPDNSLMQVSSYGKPEWDILKEVCRAEDNNGEEQLFELMYTLIDIESKSNSMNNRKGIMELLEKTLKQNFYKNEKDARDYYYDRINRKQNMGGKYDERALEGILPETEEELNEEDI
ncbi:MAG: DNA phosphorothioation system sulfurtransferase DndC [Ruminococcus sp.]|nr:DNA phosphorothioation system sulfurtransferase DndC [Ruminococcus sp.]